MLARANNSLHLHLQAIWLNFKCLRIRGDITPMSQDIKICRWITFALVMETCCTYPQLRRPAPLASRMVCPDHALAEEYDYQQLQEASWRLPLPSQAHVPTFHTTNTVNVTSICTKVTLIKVYNCICLENKKHLQNAVFSFKYIAEVFFVNSNGN